MFEGFKYIVVGAGFAGSVIAERLANDLGEKVLIIDKRNHIGGNCYSYTDQRTNIEIHKYGSHIFHTKNKEVWDYIGQFSDFNNYHHQVLASYKGKIYHWPINLFTINQFYNKNFSPFEASKFIQKEASCYLITNSNKDTNFETKAISSVGKALYEAFIKGYTIKQWEVHLSNLPAQNFSRIPICFNYNNQYFNDLYQGIPVDGYTNLFKNMLRNKNIQVKLNINFFDVRKYLSKDNIVIYTGPIDQFYNYQFGKLNWREVCFEKERVKVDDFQGNSVINYADLEIPYTRIHEFKHYNPFKEVIDTVIYYEYPKAREQTKESFYPVNTPEDNKIYNKYYNLTKMEEKTIFSGRLGTYSYLDMDKVILQALNIYNQQLKRGRNHLKERSDSYTSCL